MAEALIGPTVNLLLSQLVPVVRGNVSLTLGFKNEFGRLKEEVEMIRAVLLDAERRIAMDDDEAVKLWMKRLEDFAYEAADVLDEFAYEALQRKVKKVTRFMPSSSEPSFISKIKMSKKIKGILTSLEAINKQASDYGLQRGGKVVNYTTPPPPSPRVPIDRETDSFVDLSEVIGRDDDASEIVEMLISQSSLQTLSVLPIMGMGGIGKTTLAKMVYNDTRIKGCLNKRIWVCVSDDFDVKRILKEMLESLKKEKCIIDTMNAILEGLQKELAGEKYLLVLDDVWNEDHIKWNDFISRLRSVGTPNGSSIVVTTRITKIASVVGTFESPYSLKGLSDDSCWSIFSARAFANGGVSASGEFEAIGRQIVKKCGGLPLAAKVAGSMMRSKKEKHEWLSITDSDVWDSKGDEGRVLPILKLSFDNLQSPSLKQCFAYCSMFIKDFDMKKEELIQHWMALGYLQPDDGDNVEMEDIGNMYFNILVQSLLFQDIQTDFYGNVAGCKMHDMVHDLAQFISKPKVFIAEANTRLAIDKIPHIRHLAVHANGIKLNTILQEGVGKLLTLFFDDIKVGKELVNFKRLRVLKLHECDSKNLSSSISEMIHLRYLDLSEIGIKVLPDSITKLYHLQTLRVGYVEYLPKEMRNLIGLRHLHMKFHGEFQMPLNMGSLTCLRTLPFFFVGKEKGRQIEELGSLEKLGDELEIRCLENVKSKEAAKSAKLWRKTRINKLTLGWSSKREDNSRSIDEDVLEGLQPNSNLKALSVEGFAGDNFSSWMMNMTVSSGHIQLLLKNMVKLELRGCERVQEIPMLGQLPHLQHLELERLYGVKCISELFYGCYSSNESSSVKSDKKTFKLFPKLKKLRLDHMSNLQEWMGPNLTEEEAGLAVVMFPCLEELVLNHCRHLKTAPSDFPRLKELEIRGVDSSLPLLNICSNLTTLANLTITCVSELTSLPHSLLQNNKQHLRTIHINDCPYLESIGGSLEGLTSLKTLHLDGSRWLESLPTGLNSCTSLDKLIIRDCNNLMVPVKEIENLHSLSSLEIIGCPHLASLASGLGTLSRLETLEIGASWETGPLWKDFNSFPELDGIKSLSFSLSHLTLHGQPHWETLPEEIQHLTSLVYLRIYDFGVEALPDWFGNLLLLEELQLGGLYRLKYLPSAEAMSQLTRLSYVRIYYCPFLKERLEGNRPEFSKLSTVAILRLG